MTRMGQTTTAPTGTDTDRAVVRRLVLGSALMLFLELALIRWLGSNIVHLSYFSNFVLLGSFLGIGIGFLVSRRRWSLVPFSPLLLAILVLGVRLWPVSVDRTGSDVIYFTSLTANGPPAWVVLPTVFVVVALVIAGPAEIVGRCFADLTPLDRIPLGPHRLAGRHQPVRGAVVRVGAAGRVGRDRGGRLRAPGAAPQAGAGRRRRSARSRDPAGRVDRGRHELVAVLQGHHRGPRRATGRS